MTPGTPLSWDDYFVPGTEVLRNLYGYDDQAILTTREEFDTALRVAELAADPVVGSFDYPHLKEIHRRIFQDVYPWAGVERTAPVGSPMIKVGPDVVNHEPGDPTAPRRGYAYYPAGPPLTAAAELEFARLAAQDFLRGLSRGDLVREVAESWGELNVVHSFREGNTRTQFVFFNQLVEQAGYSLDLTLFRPGSRVRDEFVWARFHSQATGRNVRLAAVLDRAVFQPGSARTSDSDVGATRRWARSAMQPPPRPSGD